MRRLLQIQLTRADRLGRMVESVTCGIGGGKKIVAESANRAAFTGRLARMTGIATVLNELNMELIIVFSRNHSFHDRMGIVGGHLLGQEADALADAEDMRIHGEGGASIGKAQHDGSGLGTDALERDQPVLGLVNRQVIEEIDAVFPTLSNMTPSTSCIRGAF